MCILTFGCTYNEGDSSRLFTILTNTGCILVSDPGEADVVVVNTCIVIDKTERKMIRLLRELVTRNKEIIVTGCLPSARGEILKEFPGVRVLFPEEVYEVSQGMLPLVTGSVAVVQVGSGCLGSCTYCITRVARGRIQSIPEETILHQIQDAVCMGAVEIRLTGQDLSAYGCDSGIPRLPSLLRKIALIPGAYHVRLGMMNPATLLPIAHEVAYILRNKQFFAFVHLPVQSGSDAVLALMGREYTISEYYSLVQIFREIVPGITIATDIIAGFTGETEDDFKATCVLLKTIRPGMVNVTRYSYRPGSTVSRKNELPDRIRKERSREYIRLGYAIIKEEKKKLVGENCTVMITEHMRSGTVFGRTDAYTGVVLPSDLPIGGRYLVEITDERIHYLIGRVISPL